LEDLLIQTIKKLGYKITRQGSLSPNEKYQDHFFTYWNNSANGDGFYDNSETRTVWDFDLNFYSIDPLMTYSMIGEAKKALIEAGFEVYGKGYDIPSDEVTHTGRGIRVIYLEV
jgi:hypothetical protein